MIQHNYRTYRIINLAPKFKEMIKNENAIIVQKYLRGYLIRHVHYSKVRFEKMAIHRDFFDIMKEKALLAAKDVIWNSWKEYKKRRLAKIEQED
jgi:hypothetical protein